jgi:hypothetical protein
MRRCDEFSASPGCALPVNIGVDRSEHARRARELGATLCYQAAHIVAA